MSSFSTIVNLANADDNFSAVVKVGNPEDIGNTVEVADEAALPTPSLALQGLIHYAKAENTYHVVNLAGNAFEEFGAGTGTATVIADYNAATNTPDLDSTPIATVQGDRYVVTAAGLFFVKQVQVGDILLARIDNATTLANWAIHEGQEAVAENNIITSGNGTIASAATTDIGAEIEKRLTVTGTTAITSFGTVAAGTEKTLIFSGILTLTHNATSLILQTGANIATVAEDVLTIISLGSGNWRVTNYQRKDGKALVGDGGGDVTGPGSAVDENIAVFDFTTGKVIKDSGTNISAVTANTAKVTNATHTGDVTGSGALTIADNAVTLAKLADMATASLLGRNTAATGDPEVLSAATARSLLNIEDGSTADQTDAEIETAYNNQVTIVSQAEAEAGTATTRRGWTAERVKQAIAALETGGGNTFADNVFRVQDDGDNTKQIAFQASGITTATTRTITMPDTDVALSDIATNNAKVTNATHTGDVTGATALTIADNAVTLAKMADMATASLIGRNTAATGDPEILSAATARSLLNVEDGSTADQTDAEIETAYSAQVAAMSQATAEAGTSTTIERVTAERIKQAVLKLAPLEFAFALSDTAGDLVAATDVESFRAPFAFTWTKVIIEVGTAGTGGTLITVDVNINGSTGLSTKATIDASEFTSEDAATAPVISTSAIAKDDLFRFDIDDIGSTIAGERLKIWIIGTR